MEQSTEVPLAGFEPTTFPLGEGRSILLSYRGVLPREYLPRGEHAQLTRNVRLREKARRSGARTAKDHLSLLPQSCGNRAAFRT